MVTAQNIQNKRIAFLSSGLGEILFNTFLNRIDHACSKAAIRRAYELLSPGGFLLIFREIIQKSPENQQV
jgi:hypothetical protein